MPSSPVTTLSEADIEQVALDWLQGLGWCVAHGPDIAPDTPTAERSDYGQVVLELRLRDALSELNPDLPGPALDDAYRKLTRPRGWRSRTFRCCRTSFWPRCAICRTATWRWSCCRSCSTGS